MGLPSDVFTEPQDVDPDTSRHLGPLRPLIGIWQGRGVDVNPKAEGPETRNYLERVVMQPIDAQANGPQLFYGLRYHTHITTDDEDITFHDQVGYWLWEPATGLVMQSLSIPRGQTVLASGKATPNATSLTVSAQRGRTDYGICSTSFLEEAFRTESYRLTIEFHGDGTWSYDSETILMVRGVDRFLHQDRNTLTKVGDVPVNPWLSIQS